MTKDRARTRTTESSTDGSFANALRDKLSRLATQVQAACFLSVFVWRPIDKSFFMWRETTATKAALIWRERFWIF